MKENSKKFQICPNMEIGIRRNLDQALDNSSGVLCFMPLKYRRGDKNMHSALYSLKKLTFMFVNKNRIFIEIFRLNSTSPLPPKLSHTLPPFQNSVLI